MNWTFEHNGKICHTFLELGIEFLGRKLCYLVLDFIGLD